MSKSDPFASKNGAFTSEIDFHAGRANAAALAGRSLALSIDGDCDLPAFLATVAGKGCHHRRAEIARGFRAGVKELAGDTAESLRLMVG